MALIRDVVRQALATVWSTKFYNPTCQAIAAEGRSVAIEGQQEIKLLILLERSISRICIPPIRSES